MVSGLNRALYSCKRVDSGVFLGEIKLRISVLGEARFGHWN